VTQERKNKELLEREKRRKEQEEAIASIRYTPTPYPLGETKYFELVPTKITNYLFLGTHTCTRHKDLLKSRYGITHVVNCSKNENYHPEHFYYLNPQIPGQEDTENKLIDLLPSFFEFVTNAGKQQGRILVVSEEGVGSGVALVLGFMMENLKLSFFEIFKLVQSKRYVIQLDARYIQQLLSWDKKNQKEDFKERFSCLCGANEWTLLLPFDKTEHQNPMTCACVIGQFSACPNHGCGKFCEDMMKRFEGVHGNLACRIGQWIKWGHTTKDNLQGIFGACEEHTPLLGLPQDQQLKIEEKSWTVYRCRHCQFICYAENKKDQYSIAIVTNIKNVN